MYIINVKNNKLMIWDKTREIPENYKEFPSVLVNQYYSYNKFVKINYDEEGNIIGIIKDEEKENEFLSSNMTNEELTKENELLKTQIKALSDNQTFLEDCLIEVGQVVYA